MSDSFEAAVAAVQQAPVTEPERKTLPNDLYALRVIGAEFRRANNDKQTPYINVELEVARGEWRGFRVWDRWWLTAPAHGMLIERFRVFGLEFDSIPPADLCSSLIATGSTALGNVEAREYAKGDGSKGVSYDVKRWQADPDNTSDPLAPAAPVEDDLPW